MLFAEVFLEVGEDVLYDLAVFVGLGVVVSNLDHLHPLVLRRPFCAGEVVVDGQSYQLQFVQVRHSIR